MADIQMEAQKLVSISLTKMAQSRAQRTGVSLHKSLLVATVLQKARFLCMEEVFRMVNAASYDNANSTCNESAPYDLPMESDEEVELDSSYDREFEPFEKCGGGGDNDHDHENAYEMPTYFDLDKTPREQGFNKLKRRSEEEDTLFVHPVPPHHVPKRKKIFEFEEEDSFVEVFDEEPDFRAGEPAKAMDIDRITSLVSIFSFGANPNGQQDFSRSPSPDMCSAQAKEAENMQQRIALTV